MIVKDITLKSPKDNILYDEVLLRCAEAGQSGEILRFWESPRDFIVLGRISKEEDDVNMPEARRHDIPVLRRSSGGGTVIQGKGCLNYTLILSKILDKRLVDLRKSYAVILGKVVQALNSQGARTAFYPISDIALIDGQKKISGNAQKRGRRFILHHGTILYDFDLSKIERFLKMPKETPTYRERRAHLDFVGNVPLTAADIKDSLQKIFTVEGQCNELDETEFESLQALHDV